MLLAEYVASDDATREAYLAGLGENELLRLGVELYNAGEYWHAHEAWEQVWLDAPSEERYFYQGLIQVTAAFVHVVRNEYPGAVRLLDAGLAKLDGYPASHNGVAVAELREGARAALTRLVALGERRLSEFDRGTIPQLRYEPPAGPA